MHILQHHLRAAKDSLKQMWRHFWANTFTIAVIGIALALPVMLAVIITNIQDVTRGLDIGNQITVFLKNTTTEADARKLVNEWRTRKGIERVEYFNRDETLKQFREHSGFGEALDLLPTNPLPAVIVIHPKMSSISNQEIDLLAEQIKRLPVVELVQLDQDWLQRLQALIKVGEHGIMILSILLIVAVALIIGNTIRLLIENRHEEIALITIIGGTPAFVRRPFLYTGVFFGLCGGILACILVNIGLLTLQKPVLELANLYNSAFMLAHMKFVQIANVLFLSMFAGWVSAFLVVSHYLLRKSS